MTGTVTIRRYQAPKREVEMRAEVDRLKATRFHITSRIDALESRLSWYACARYYTEIPWEGHDEASAQEIGYTVPPNYDESGLDLREVVIDAAPAHLHDALRRGFVERDARKKQPGES